MFREQSPFKREVVLSNQKLSVPLPTSPLPWSEISSTLKLTSHPSVEALIQTLEASISPQVTNRHASPDLKASPKPVAVIAAEITPVIIPYKILIPITRPTATTEASPKVTSSEKLEKKRSPTLKSTWDERIRCNLGAMETNMDHISKRYSENSLSGSRKRKKASLAHEFNDEDDKTEIIVGEENAGDTSRKILKPEDKVGLQYLDCKNAFQAEVFIKQELFSEYENYPGDDQLKVSTREETISSEENSISSQKCDKSLRHGKTPTKQHPCDICDKSFTRVSYLKRHKQIHSGEKPFSCDSCEKSFARVSDLMRHKQIHSGEKRYSCDICEKSFVNAFNLKVYKRIHTGEKLYSCDACDKTFALASQLKVHLRIHTGDNPYSCSACRNTFNQPSHLKKHEGICILKSLIENHKYKSSTPSPE